MPDQPVYDGRVPRALVARRWRWPRGMRRKDAAVTERVRAARAVLAAGRPDASRRDADRGGPAARSSGVGVAQLVPTARPTARGGDRGCRAPRRAASRERGWGALGDLGRAGRALACGCRCSGPARRARGTVRRDRGGDGLRLPLRPDPQAVRHRLPVRLSARWIPRTTTCSPPRRAWPASWRSPRARCRWSTGSAWAAPSPSAGGDTALVSWSGSMFEYLMPALVMRSFPGTLLDQTYHERRAAADRVRGASAGCRGA